MQNKFSFVIGDSFVNLTNIQTGNSQTVVRGDARFDQAVALLKAKKFEELESFLDVKVQVNSSIKKAEAAGVNFVVFIEDGKVFYRYKNSEKVELHNAIVDRIVNMAKAGFDVVPMCKFMANLLSNPSKTAINELYLFLEACQLPITEDGHFIAYKIVKEDYMDIYTGKTCRHQVGDKPEMPRFEVDDNRNNTCSKGLHFCSKSYLNHYGSSNRDTDRAVLVKINPADVVSIPSDYRNAKGRAWTYEVVGEVKAGWRETLPQADYTNKPVVDAKGADVAPEKVAVKVAPIGTKQFVFNNRTNRWHDTTNNNGMVSRRVVAQTLGVTVEQVEAQEV